MYFHIPGLNCILNCQMKNAFSKYMIKFQIELSIKNYTTLIIMTQ